MKVESIDNKKLKKITKLLLDNRSTNIAFWEWLSDLNGKSLDKKTANKFFFCCIIDYQMKAETVWGRGREFLEETIQDPDDLWGWVTSFSHRQWMSKFNEFGLHRFPKAHERLWRIGNIIVEKYDGDVRNIWKNNTPSDVLRRLYDMRMGEQISNMVIGALIDTGQIEGKGDVKADINVKRVLGRALVGKEFSVSETIEVARKMYPKNPWLLDRELYLIGKELCFEPICYCDDCYLFSECEYSKLLVYEDEVE